MKGRHMNKLDIFYLKQNFLNNIYFPLDDGVECEDSLDSLRW